MELLRFFVTLGPIGSMAAPGTIAAFCTIPCVFWVKSIVPNSWAYLGFISLLIGISWFAINYVLKSMKRNDDPQEIVLDEVVGCMLTFWDVPLTTPVIVLGFLLFRFFDISKCAGVMWGERLDGASGIIADDLIAAIISNMILRFLL